LSYNALLQNENYKLQKTNYYTRYQKDIGNLLKQQIYTRTRHMGIPYYKAFDFYTLLVSILTIPSFYFFYLQIIHNQLHVFGRKI
jgi:hypothetical protein